MPAVHDLQRPTSMAVSTRAIPRSLSMGGEPANHPSSTQRMRRVSSSTSGLCMSARNSSSALSSMSLRRNGSMSHSSSTQSIRRNNSSFLSSNEQKSVSGMDHALWNELRQELASNNAHTGAAVSEVTRNFLEKNQVNTDRASPKVNRPTVILDKNTNLRDFQNDDVDPSRVDRVHSRGSFPRRNTTCVGDDSSAKKNVLISSMQTWQSLRSMVMSSMDALAEEVEEEHPSALSEPAMSSKCNIAVKEDSCDFTDIFQKDIMTPEKSTDYQRTGKDSIESLLFESERIVVPAPDGSESLVFKQSGKELFCEFESGPMSGKRSSITTTDPQEELYKILQAAGEIDLEDDE